MYAFKASIWLSVPVGLAVRMSISTGSFSTKWLDPYLPVIRQDEFGEGLDLHNPSGTAWIWADCRGGYRTLFLGPID